VLKTVTGISSPSALLFNAGCNDQIFS